MERWEGRIKCQGGFSFLYVCVCVCVCSCSSILVRTSWSWRISQWGHFANSHFFIGLMWIRSVVLYTGSRVVDMTASLQKKPFAANHCCMVGKQKKTASTGRKSIAVQANKQLRFSFVKLLFCLRWCVELSISAHTFRDFSLNNRTIQALWWSHCSNDLSSPNMWPKFSE